MKLVEKISSPSMARYFLSIIFLFTFLPFAFSTNCTSLKEEETLLSMAYENFDQSDQGWRQYVRLNCYQEIGKLIDQ